MFKNFAIACCLMPLLLLSRASNGATEIPSLVAVANIASTVAVYQIASISKYQLYASTESNAPKYLYEYTVTVQEKLVGEPPTIFCAFKELDVGARYLTFLSAVNVREELANDWLLQQVPENRRTNLTKFECRHNPTMGNAGIHEVVDLFDRDFVLLEDAYISACQLVHDSPKLSEAYAALRSHLRFAVGLDYVKRVVRGGVQSDSECAWGLFYIKHMTDEMNAVKLIDGEKSESRINR